MLVTTLLFWKFCFSLRTSLKSWFCTNNRNAHIFTFCKRCFHLIVLFTYEYPKVSGIRKLDWIIYNLDQRISKYLPNKATINTSFEKMSRNLIFQSISKHAEIVPVVRLVGLKIAHLSCALYVLYLHHQHTNKWTNSINWRP